MAQTGSALPWGGRGRRFKSSLPDQLLSDLSLVSNLSPALSLAFDPFRRQRTSHTRTTGIRFHYDSVPFQFHSIATDFAYEKALALFGAAPSRPILKRTDSAYGEVPYHSYLVTESALSAWGSHASVPCVGIKEQNASFKWEKIAVLD